MIQHAGSGFPGKALPAILLLVLSGTLFAASDEEKLIERIMPVGTVCVAGDSCASGVTVALASGSGGPQDPQQIYNTYCMACHATGANNAPVYGNAEAWQPHIEKGVDTLYQSAINGFNNNAMPPKGLCMDCSEDAIRATVDYILSAVQ